MKNIKKSIVIFTILVFVLLTISTVNATDCIKNGTVDDVIICESHNDGLHGTNDIEDAFNDNINKNSVKDNSIGASNSKTNNANTKPLKSIKYSNTVSYSVINENELTVTDYDDLCAAVKYFNDNKRVGTITLEGNAIYSVPTSNEITIDSSITINGNGRTIQGFRSQSSENVIRVLKGNTVTIFNLNFNDNVPKQYGIINNEGNLTLKNIKVTNSSGMNAIAIYNEGNLELNESIFENLHYNNGYSYRQGGAIHIHKGAANITNCNFTNCSTIMAGGAISIANYDDDSEYPIVLINKSIFKNNIASGDYECGGAIRIAKSDVTIISCDFINNAASKFGGAIIIDDEIRSSSKINMVGNSFSDNHADVGGAVFIQYNDNTLIDGNTFRDNYAEVYYGYGWGGTFYVADSEITLTNNNVYGGHATVLADFFCNNNSTIKSENNTISGFHSTSSEVVLYNYGVFNSTNDTIKNCFNDFIIYNDESSELYLQNGTIVNNGANKVVIFNNGSASLYYNNISNNYVINMSSYVIYNEESCTIDMAHNLFVNNTDNTRDMLLNNDTGRTFNVESNNVYVDNFLEDYWYVTDTVDIISNEETPIHVINLRDVYNNVIVNGTIICYLEDSKDVFATFDVKNGYALITLAESPNLPLGEHIFKLEYESLSKHYQNLVGGVLRVNLKPELIDINVTAVWVDGNNQDGLRPSSVSVNLTANGVVVDNVILNETNGWKYSFADLPKFKDGSEIKYNFSEVNIPNYSSEVKNTGNEFKVINTHVPGTVEVNVLIVWDDANNNDGIAPNNIKIQLYADGKTVGEPITLNRGNNQYVFKDLPEYDGEKLIKYSVDELEVPNGYTKTSTNKDNIVTITNKHELEKVNFKVDIILEGLDNSLNQVNLQLYADGEVVGKPVKITLSTDNEFIFKNLLKYKNGKLIKYNVKLVDLPEGFKESTTESQYGLVIKLSKITKKSTLKWSWKLLKIAHKTKHYEKNNKNHTQYTKKHSIVKKALKTSKVTIKHVKYIKHNNYSKYNRHKKYNNRKSHKSCMERVTYKYRLYIYLYGEYMNGSMSYDDFVAILKENNIKVSKSNWDKNGVLVIDYNDIKNVPDNITLHNKKGDVPDSTSKVNKIKAKKSKNTITEKEVDTKADNTKSDTKGVVDSDEIEVKTENN